MSLLRKVQTAKTVLKGLNLNNHRMHWWLFKCYPFRDNKPTFRNGLNVLNFVIKREICRTPFCWLPKQKIHSFVI